MISHARSMPPTRCISLCPIMTTKRSAARSCRIYLLARAKSCKIFFTRCHRNKVIKIKPTAVKCRTTQRHSPPSVASSPPPSPAGRFIACANTRTSQAKGNKKIAQEELKTGDTPTNSTGNKNPQTHLASELHTYHMIK